ncbi:sensor histidine kinase [Paenibacillus tundrae]|uniref:histidine kinase n=1 Tax=Paenibacillus tundrae TaxID=528187 RepID=A0ABT9W877_9BACL|nr:HAMP domain-containing sensor histidine kinase [Paenibacillus tundrae]MDQ0169277.1 signal transduction histidine kinase [Paenibacillus tundrae]
MNKKIWKHLVMVVISLLLVSFLVGYLPYVLTSFLYKMWKFNPSDWLAATINGLLGFILAMILMSVLMMLLRPQRDRRLQPIIDSMKRISSGEYDRAHLNESRIKGYSMSFLSRNVNRMAEELTLREKLNQEFISNVSHEIQSPLTAIKGFTHVLRNPELTIAERTHYLDIIERESNRLSNLSTNMQKLSWLKELNLDMKIQNFRLDQQLREVVLTMEYHWSQKDIELSVHLQETQCLANEELLNQVWMNLLDNAIKFTPNGGQIRIDLTNTHRGLVVEIRDNGIGMTADEQNRIFERFYKSDRSRNREKKGSGLGLSIVQKIVELHHGKISVSSVPNDGTTFTVHLTNGELETNEK